MADQDPATSWLRGPSGTVALMTRSPKRTHYGAIAGALSVWSTLTRAVAPPRIGLASVAWEGSRPIPVTPAILSALAVLSADRALSAEPSAPLPAGHPDAR